VTSDPAAQRRGDVASRRHRVVAIGSGLGGLTATKALKHAQVNVTDALTFLTRVTAQGTSHVLNQTPQWLQVIPTAGVAATIGVLIALHVAVAREPTRLHLFAGVVATNVHTTIMSRRTMTRRHRASTITLGGFQFASG
jgi:hypothetical protein